MTDKYDEIQADWLNRDEKILLDQCAMAEAIGAKLSIDSVVRVLKEVALERLNCHLDKPERDQ